MISGEEGGETGVRQPSAAVPGNSLVPTFGWLLCIFVFLLYMRSISNRSPALPLFVYPSLKGQEISFDQRELQLLQR